MTRDELIEQCRYYNGGENPFEGTGKEMEYYWNVEKEWVEHDGNLLDCGDWEYYNRLGGKKYPGIPDSLLSHFCHHFFKWSYSFKDEMEEFYKQMEDYLWIPNDHYPEDQIPSRDNFIY